MSGRVAVVLGTRPEIIKMAPVIRELDRRGGPGTALVISTGQHYDEAMAGRFWTELGLGRPAHQLEAGGLSRARCIGQSLADLGPLLDQERPDAVLVHGDTNSTVAGSLAANATGVPLVHVEAGLRSHDRAMPEEHNRVLADHLADLCCAPTPTNVDNLRAEAIPAERVRLTGNTIVEAVRRALPTPAERAEVLARRGVGLGGYVLATIHRPENTDDPQALRAIVDALAHLDLPVIFPVHPRTRPLLDAAAPAELLARLQTCEPIGPGEFLSLAAEAAVLVSDSGGVAEEVTVLGRPLVIVRRSTERPEAVAAGFATLVDPAGIARAITTILGGHTDLLRHLAETPSPYGDQTASRRVVDATFDLIDQKAPCHV